MILKHLAILIFININVSKAAIFLASSKRLEISALQAFTTETFSNLVKRLNNPEVIVFKSVSSLSPDIKETILERGYYSTYIPSADFKDLVIENETDNVKVYDSADSTEIKEMLSKNNYTDILVMMFLPSKRIKRQTKDANKGPVIYQSQNKSSNLSALLYSSQPLLLKINDPEPLELHLGNVKPHMINYDNRLNIHVVPMEDDRHKVTLRFSFSWSNGYWSMPSVKVSYTNTNKEFNLTTEEDITAPAYFSYHCNGQTVFSDPNGVKLFIYDLQVQTDSKNGKFGDANDCVPFMTTPIWSGLLVTALLGIGLVIALTAILDIKTMDKFDNQKTKNLAVTVSE